MRAFWGTGPPAKYSPVKGFENSPSPDSCLCANRMTVNTKDGRGK